MRILFLRAAFLAVAMTATSFFSPGRAFQNGPDLEASEELVASDYAFAVLRNGRKIGEHRIVVTTVDEGFTVQVTIDLAVRLGPIPLYRYFHENEESWQAGRLVSLRAFTRENGKEFNVTGRQTGSGFLVTGSKGELELPADILTSTYWQKRTVASTAMLDTQRGVLVTYRAAGPVYDEMFAAERYELTGDLTIDLWYEGDHLTRMAFDNDGALIEYQPIDSER